MTKTNSIGDRGSPCRSSLKKLGEKRNARNKWKQKNRSEGRGLDGLTDDELKYIGAEEKRLLETPRKRIKLKKAKI